MKKVIFCEITWMKNYWGVTETDKPKHGGKYVAEHEFGGEVYNFYPYNHECYGYVMHYGDVLHIDRFDKVSENQAKIDGMTVVWVAKHKGGRKIVGWYENAEMYREWQAFSDIRYCGEEIFNYNFKAKETDCYLIPESERNFSIPSASVNGKGKGMGQAQIWYAESSYAQTELIPSVLEYLDQIRTKVSPIYYTNEILKARAGADILNGETYFEAANRLLSNRKKEEALAVANSAVASDDSHDTRLLRGEVFGCMNLLNEAAEDFREALCYEPDDADAMERLMYVEMMCGHNFIAIELGERLREQKDHTEAWSDAAFNLLNLYVAEREIQKAEILLVDCEKEPHLFDAEELRKGKAWLDELKQIQKSL